VPCSARGCAWRCPPADAWRSAATAQRSRCARPSKRERALATSRVNSRPCAYCSVAGGTPACGACGASRAEFRDLSHAWPSSLAEAELPRPPPSSDSLERATSSAAPFKRTTERTERCRYYMPRCECAQLCIVGRLRLGAVKALGYYTAPQPTAGATPHSLRCVDVYTYCPHREELRWIRTPGTVCSMNRAVVRVSTCNHSALRCPIDYSQ
jgi:hypothetical protein